jgi:hypothetical protein
MPTTQRPTNLSNRVADVNTDVRDFIGKADVIAAALKMLLDDLQERYPTEYDMQRGDFMRAQLAEYHKAKE